jgi:thioredoxin-like negative regulator of GroEL
MAINNPVADRSFQWNDREVRRLLRLLRRPKALEYSPLALAIQSAAGASTAHEAVLSVIERSLAEYGREGRELFTLLKRCDIDGDATPLGVAYELNLSTRQFYRYRARAVGIIVAFLDGLFRVRSVDANPIRALARLTQSFDPQTALKIYALDAAVKSEDHSMMEASISAGNATSEIEAALSKSPQTLSVRAKLASAFARRGESSKARAAVSHLRRSLAAGDARMHEGIELEIALIEFLLARYEGAPEIMLEIARKVRALASTRTRTHVLATLCQAQAALHAGDFGSSLGALRALINLPAVHQDPPLMGEVVLRIGETLFALGDIAEAQRHITAASLTLRHIPHVALECELLLNRMRLRSGAMPELSTIRLDRSHDALMMDAIRARGLLGRAKVADAEEIANRVLTIAREMSFRGLEIWNLATLAAAAFMKHDSQTGATRAAQAWALLMRVRDCQTACDAFACPGMGSLGLGPVPLDETLQPLLEQALLAAFPAAPVVTDVNARSAFVRAVCRLIEFQLGRCEERANLAAVGSEITDALVAAGTPSHVLRRHQRSLATTLAYFLATLLPAQLRAGFSNRMSCALEDLLRSVAQGMELQ